MLHYRHNTTHMTETFEAGKPAWPKKVPVAEGLKDAGSIADFVEKIPGNHEVKIVITYNDAHSRAAHLMPVSDIRSFLVRNNMPGLKLMELVDYGPLEEGEGADLSFEQESRENERPILVIVRRKTADGTKSIVTQEEARSRLEILNALAKAQNKVSEIEQDPNRPEGKVEVRQYSDLEKLPDWLIQARKS